MKRTMTTIACVLGLGAFGAVGCESAEEERMERMQETAEEVAEGRAEAASAAAGENEIMQEYRGMVAEEQMEDAIEEHAERMEDVGEPEKD